MNDQNGVVHNRARIAHTSVRRYKHWSFQSQTVFCRISDELYFVLRCNYEIN